jgi:hypothetical protein
MVDDFRTPNSDPELFEEPFPSEEELYDSSFEQVDEDNFLGMTAPQRFVIVLLLLILTCILGSFGLILTEKVVLPFF